MTPPPAPSGGRPINILFLIRTWAIGGGNTIIRLLLRHLPRDRYNILTAVYDAPESANEEFAAKLIAEGFTVIPERIPWRSRLGMRRLWASVESLAAQYDIDLIHTHDPHSNVAIGLGRRRYSQACVASSYGWWDRFFPLRAHLHIWAERRLALPRFDEVITVSETMKKRILEGPTDPDHIHVVNTGIEPGFMDSGASRAETRDRLGIPHDACVVGAVSRLYPEKGHEHLLRAAAMLRDAHPDLHLLIVGTGPLLRQLKRRAATLGISGRVVFAGYCDDLPGMLRAMDIFALPSILQEGFPTVALEAECAGLPVVASDIGGTWETMRDGVTGLLVPPGVDKPLAEAISALAGDPERRVAMGAAGRELATTSFTLEGMMARIAAAYEAALLGNASKPPRCLSPTTRRVPDSMVARLP